MRYWQLFLYLFMMPLMSLFSMQTDHLIFLFDNGEKNMMASMLNYARNHDAAALDALDFRIVFMGASVDAMFQEPFCHYPDKLIYYKQIGVDETVDHQWKRDQKLSQASIERLTQSFDVKKKVWLPVSCSIFQQLLHDYQDRMGREVVVFRDNPSPAGDSDYFLIADEIQSRANQVLVPSEAACAKLDPLHQKIGLVGHGPIEEWCDQVKSLDQAAIIERLRLNPLLPVIVYAGVYGEGYENSFKLFLDLVPDEEIQVLIIPHPRYKGVVEKKLCADLQQTIAKIYLLGEWEADPSKRAKTIEALAIADVVVTADATSTIVFQANALKKKVLYVNSCSSAVGDLFCEKKLIYRVRSSEELLANIKQAAPGQDVFELLGMPRNGSKLLWERVAVP